MSLWPFSGKSLRSLAGAAEDARSATLRSKQAEFELVELRTRVDRLVRANQAMWELLKAQHGWQDERLQKEIDKLEAAELSAAPTGADALSAPRGAIGVRTCKDCARTVSRRHSVCIYCGGAELIDAPDAPPIG